MNGKLFSVIFLILVSYCIWYYFSYSNAYSAEFEAEQKVNRDTLELMTARNLRVWRKSKGQKNSAEVSIGNIGELILYNSGKLILNDGVSSSQFEGNLQTESLLTDKVVALLKQKEGEKLLSQRYQQLAWFEFPREFSFFSEGRTLKSSQMKFDLLSDVARTEKSVEIFGPGYRLSGVGLKAKISLREFTLDSKIKGEYDPKFK